MMTLDPSFKGVVFNYLTPVLYDNLIQRKNFTFRICREVLNTNSFVFYFTKNFYLVDEFDQLIQSLESAGLLDFILTKHVDLNLMRTYHKQPPSALNYNNIEGFFVLFYYGCVLALVSFLCELVFAYLKDRRQVQRAAACHLSQDKQMNVRNSFLW